MNTYKKALVTGIFAVTLAAPALAGVYKWVGKDGRVHYGDRPPPDDAVQAQEVNRSGVPMALQERLRGLDSDFVITRISGNLETAYVCGEYNTESVPGEPRFPRAVERARLGSVKHFESRYDNDDEDNRSYRSEYSDQRCPQRSKMRDMAQRMYEIRFDSEAVSAYRAAPN